MTRIVELRVHRVSSPLVRPFITAIRRADFIEVVLVEAIDGDGRSGWGEAAMSWRVTGESPGSVEAAVRGPLSDAVIGASVNDSDLLVRSIASALTFNSAARNAVECAVTDLRAQNRGESFAATLGAGTLACSSDELRIRTDMTLSAGTFEQMRERAYAHVAEGFTCLKIKASAGSDIPMLMRVLRAELGPSIALRVDANQAWTADEAIRIVRECEDSGVGLELVEQPVAAHDFDALASVTAAVSTPILADESVWTTRDLDRVISRRAADLINIKLAKTGGPCEALRLHARAQAAGMHAIVGCMMESAVGVNAGAALAAVVRPDGVHDLDAGLWLRESPVNGGLKYEKDSVVLANAPGLGITGLAKRSAA